MSSIDTRKAVTLKFSVKRSRGNVFCPKMVLNLRGLILVALKSTSERLSFVICASNIYYCIAAQSLSLLGDVAESIQFGKTTARLAL